MIDFSNIIAIAIVDAFATAFEMFEQIKHLYVHGFQSPFNSNKSLSHHQSPLHIVQGMLEEIEDNPLINFCDHKFWQVRLYFGSTVNSTPWYWDSEKINV